MPFVAAGSANARQLIALRWLAVVGQTVTIVAVRFGMGIDIPLLPLLGIVAALVALNLASIAWERRREGLTDLELFAALLADVAALTALLYLTGGATNPFIWLFLLQVVLAAILLTPRSSWAIVGVTSGCSFLLIHAHRPLPLPPAFGYDLFELYTAGAFTCFALIAVLLVLFVTRIVRNLRGRDQRLADMRQRAAEEDHIVRMGLLASGAAHELGTPLASLSVIVNDWRRSPALAADPGMAEEIDEMRVAVERCKAIVTGILLSAGEARGEHAAATTVHRLLRALVDDWRGRHGAAMLRFDDRFGRDVAVVTDTALQQVIDNVLDNAVEASGAPVTLIAARDGDTLELRVCDDGPGFPAAMLADFGKPYRSTKDRPGSGLGLFLVTNAMRKLGGAVEAYNRPGGGAVVRLTLPLAPMSLQQGDRR